MNDPESMSLSVAEDITARKVLEDELKASQTRYERVVMAMRGFMFTVLFEGDRPARTMHYPGAREVTGYSGAEYQANPALWFSMIVEEDRPLVTHQIEAVQKEKKTQSVEHRIRHKDGTIRWVRNVSVPTVDAQQRLTSYDGLITDITDLKEAEAHRDRLLEETRRLAVRDATTGLYSRRVLEEELHRAWQLGERRHLPLSLLMLDLDHFKILNDTYGHLVGDQVLMESSRLIRATVRAGDTVIRYGGDEIVAILPLTGLEETHSIGERLLDTFRRHRFCQGVHDLHATISVGAASGSGSAQPPSQILMRADQALYRAKRWGRNLLCLSEPDSASPFVLFDHSTPITVAGIKTLPPGGKGRILVVDDDPLIGSLLTAILGAEHYSVATALNAEEAQEIESAEPGQIDVALVDLRLADHNGLQVLKQLRLMDDTLVGVVMTGNATVDSTTEALRTGAFDFVQKPISASQLSPVIDRAMQYRRQLHENRLYQRHLENLVTERGIALSQALSQVRLSRQATVDALATMLATHEKHIGDHCQRVALMAQILASEMHVAVEAMETIRQGGLLHDIGKIAIPDAILMKQGPLTPDEWRIVKSHPQTGYDVVHGYSALEETAALILEHHERFDGSGYPRGLKGSEIGLGARIFAVADTYDVIRSNRPYSPLRGTEEAVAEIVKYRGSWFDPDVVDSFLRCQLRLEECIAAGSH